jgi:hypothetical protein
MSLRGLLICVVNLCSNLMIDAIHQCYGGVEIPIINRIFIESNYSRLSNLFCFLSCPKTQPRARLQEGPFP